MRTIRPVLLAIIAGISIAGRADAQTREAPEAATGWDPKPLARAEERMIVAANPHAAAAGLDMMRAGGSAADAAIAALLVLNVVEPQSSGIGGGAFALVHAPDGTLTTYDARETAPTGAEPGMFLEDGEPMPFLTAVQSGRSIGVPGLMRLLEELHHEYGRLGWAELFAPAVRLAREGFEVSPRLASLVERYEARIADTDAANVFLPDGRPIPEGALLRQPELADTLELLADRGAVGFYSGRIAGEIIAAAAAEPRPGTLSLSDLEGYELKERPPVCMGYRTEWRVCGMGPPSSGATTVGQIVGILDEFETDGLRLGGPQMVHLFAEASRLAYADRARYLADPDHVEVPVEGLLDPGYLADRAALIDPAAGSDGPAEAGDAPRREGRLHAPDAGLGRPGTTHLSVIDGEGLALSITASIESAFGSGRMAAGFLLNNQLTDFSFRMVDETGRRIVNAPAPGKRPRSSMAPTIVYALDAPERPAILNGSPGGSRIPEYVSGSLVAMLDFGRNPAEAAAEGHVSHRNRGAVVLEDGVHPPSLTAALREMGHAIETAEMTSGLHIIRRLPDGMLLGGADPRREGVALGD